MSGRPAPEAKWDVASRERLRELIAAPVPLRLRAGPTVRSFHRDIYYDTPDGSLGRREITCRFRIGADDRRRLLLTLPDDPAGRGAGRRRIEAPVTALDLGTALNGTTEPARRLRGLVDPAELQPTAELEVERTVREARGRWPWQARYALIYDAVTVRHEGLRREFQEVKARRVRAGAPSLDALSAALAAERGLRPVLESKLARAQRLATGLEAEAIARSIAGGRAVTVVALAAGAIAFVADGDALRLPIAEGQGEAACRHLLEATFGSAVGDLALLGSVPGRGGGRPQEVWLVRRLRLDAEAPPAIVWLGADEALMRVGGPQLRDPDTLAALDVAMRSELLREPVTSPSARRTGPTHLPRPRPESGLLLSADLSLVEFQERVLGLAERADTPLLERLTFLAIVSGNLDEFFMVNVGALKQAGDDERQEGALEAIALRIRGLAARQQRLLAGCLAELAGAGVRLRRWADLAEPARAALETRFRREIFPLITPRAITVSPGFPVAVMPALSLLVAVLLQDSETGPSHVAYLRIPDRLPRFLPVEGSEDRIPIEEVVRANLDALYSRRQVEGAWLFRLTRAADLELDEEESGNLLQAIEESVQRRARNPVVRVELERAMPKAVRERLLWELRFERGAETSGQVGEADLVDVDGMLDLRALRELAGLPVPGGCYPRFEGRDPWSGETDLWGMLRRQDALVHHPFESFAATTARFFTEAAADPAVLAVRLTLYRVGERSPIVDALLHALERGKEVALFVELKARFDEARNVSWVRRLEEAGATVVYGVVGLKNHAKVGLVLRREGDAIQRYVHVGTGNYNAATARVYTDLSLFSADPALGADIHDLFNQLIGSSRPPGGGFRHIAVAPDTLLPWLLGRIEREAEHARAGRPARIRAKLNGLADEEVIEALYAASRAGVPVELVVRGLCTLRPGVPGHSERIRVVSRLGRYLEHARVYHFTNGGEEEYSIGSADWRPRNLRRRIEVVAPVADPAARERLRRLLDTELADPDAWELQPDGGYRIATMNPAGQGGGRTGEETS